MDDDLMKDLEMKMNNAFESMLRHFSRIRTGRASVAILDDVKVNYYGQQTPVKQLCNISIPEARLIVIQPWDKSILAEIEKSLSAANLGVHPQNDGNVIRLPFQPLTEDKRKEIVKQVKKLAEDTKVSIRNVRREGNDTLKKQRKSSEISEDDEKKAQTEIQELTDTWIDRISETATNKEKEIMEV